MSASGSEVRRTRSARLPAATVPDVFSSPRHRAGVSGAVRRASAGLSPQPASSSSSSARLKPEYTSPTRPTSVPVKSGTPAACIARTVRLP